MPRKAKPAPRKPVTNPQSKREFVLTLPSDMPAKEVVAKAEAAGFATNEQRVHAIRWTARQAAKKGKARAKAAPSLKATKTAPATTAGKPSKAAAPKAKKAPATAAKPGKTTKAGYVLGFPQGTPAADIIATGAAAGIKLSAAHIYAIRATAKARAKKGGASSAPSKAIGIEAKKPEARVGRQPRDGNMTGAGIAALDPLDLAYAVGRLIESGKTTAPEVVQLAGERSSRISTLEAELAALKGGSVPATAPVTVAKAVRAPKTGKKAKRAATKKAGKVKTQAAGPKAPVPPKVAAARKLQGQYMGYLRQFPEKEKGKFKAIAKDEGIKAAVAALKQQRGKK